MSTFQEQTIQCKDCEKSFTFTAEDARTFEEKGYKNLPIRCPECRKEKNQRITKLRRRKTPAGGRRYTKPLPPPSSVATDGKTVCNGGTVIYVSRSFGFIDYDGGQVYFERNKFEGDQTKIGKGLYVDFVCDKDDQGRVFAKTVYPSASAPPADHKVTTSRPVPAKKVNKKATAGRGNTSARGRGRGRGRPRGDSAESHGSAENRTPREMVDVTVRCNGKEDKVIKKPVTGANFAIFRRRIIAAHKGDITRSFKLYHNDEMLDYQGFNNLKSGDVLTMKEIESTEE